MLFRALRVTALSGLIFAAAPPGPAFAEQPPPATAPENAEKEERAPELVPFRRDAIGGHFQVGLTGLVTFPFGSTSKDVGARTRAGWGGGGAIDLTYGVDRYVALGAYAEMGALGESRKCQACTGTFLGSGAFVRYHVSQGLRLDPWVSYGLGFTGFGGKDGDEVSHYSGVEWMRLGVGADWYLSPGLLIGPVFGLSAAHMVERPKLEAPGGPLMRATIGLRIAFDSPGRK